jgi:hypothetical protein
MRRKTDPNAWMDNLSVSDFDSTVREVFGFLCRDHKFGEPTIDNSSLWMVRSYRAHRIAVEISFDQRDRAIEVALVSLIEGNRPNGWKIDTSGRQVMIRLYEAAWHRKVPNPRVAIPRHASPQRTLRLWLEAWAEQLRVHFADVLADSDALFEELNGLRKQQ